MRVLLVLVAHLCWWVASISSNTLPTEGLFFHETFDNVDVLESGAWVKSSEAKYEGQPLKVKPVTTAIKGLEQDKGLSLSQENKHYGVSVKFPTVLDVKGKDLVVQYDLRLEDGLQCGGAYIKLLRATPDLDLSKLNGDTPYTIMFGPDKCANNNKVHFIVQYQSPVTQKWEEKHINTTLNIKQDKLHTHLYTLVMKQNNDFEIYIDKRLGKKGNLLTHMRPPINPPATVDDPTDSKPADWVDNDMIDDPDAKKPDDWDEDAPRMVENPNAQMPKGWDVNAPDKVPDPNATKPATWDDEEDGVWEAPLVDNPACKVGCGEWKRPMMPNPAYKGKWKPPRIKNPAFKGLWVPRQIPNPEHYEDKTPMNSLAPMAALAVEVWTTTGGIHFDNFAVAHTLKAAFKFADATYGVKDALETKRGDTEKREQERKNAVKQREAQRKSKDWRIRLEAAWADAMVFAADNIYAVLATLGALFVGTVGVVTALVGAMFAPSAKGAAGASAAANGAGAGVKALEASLFDDDDEDDEDDEGEGDKEEKEEKTDKDGPGDAKEGKKDK